MSDTALPPYGNRTALMTAIGVEKMGDAADALSDPATLRLENLDTDLLAPEVALRKTEHEVRNDDANSYLPFFGHDRLRAAASALVARNGALAADFYDWRRQCFISAGGLSGILNVLLAIIEPGDEVVMTSPTYVGLINRVKLAGGIPRYIRLEPGPDGWRLDLESLRSVTSARTRAFLMMSPSMPTGATLNLPEWQAVCGACVNSNAWMIYDSAMERILHHGVPHINPLMLPGMPGRTVTVGAASKEYRMIGWRVGWIVCPLQVAEPISRVAISNVVCPVGIAQQAVALAMEAANDGIAECVRTWQQRHGTIVQQLQPNYRVIPAHGGWSLLIDFAPLGMTGAQASARLLQHGVAATAMDNWGLPETGRYLRLVFANEPVERLGVIAERFKAAFG